MLHGILIIDKPAHVTSASVVEKVRRRAGVAKAGHTGTLDPLATGVLPICLGAATKLAGYLIAEDKAYEAELELGTATTTLDRTGAVLEQRLEAADALDDAALLAALAARRGPQQQLPPMFSAVKQGGVRLYEKARAGQEVERAPRAVTIHRLELLWRRGRRAAISVHCSKGTFVRSLIDDLGRDLGVGAHLVELRRTLSGSFSLAQAMALEELTPQSAAAHLIPVERMLAIPSIPVPPARYLELRDGRPEVLRELAGAVTGMTQLVGEAGGALLALVEPGPEGPRYLRVFPEGLEAAAAASRPPADVAGDPEKLEATPDEGTPLPPRGSG